MNQLQSILAGRASTVLAVVATFLTPACSDSADAPDRRKELAYLSAIMPESLQALAKIEIPAIENLAILGEGAERHLGMRLFPKQKKLNGGIRAEVSVNYPFQPGDTVRYAWRFMVPQGFATDAPKNRWWVIGQWHDQPNKTRGETWDGFPSRSPPVLISIGGKDGRPAIAIAYGPKQAQTSGPFFIEPGNWHRLIAEIRWSQGADGKASFFLDDPTKPIAVLEGPNMHNDYQHYFKFGMYRHPDIATDNWLYLDDLAITDLLTPSR